MGASTREQIDIDFDALVAAAKKKRMKLSEMSVICGRTSSYLSTMGKTGHISREVYEDLKRRLRIDVGRKNEAAPETPEQMTITFPPQEVTLSAHTMHELARMIVGMLRGEEDDLK